MFKNKKKKKNLIFYKSLSMINDKIFAFNNIGEYKVINPIDGTLEKSISTKFIPYNMPFSVNNKLYEIVSNGHFIEIANTK